MKQKVYPNRTKQAKILVILGATSSGKSDLGVELAKKFNGEIISADSRQVYKGLDIGTGKITRQEMKGVPHHLLDVVSPRNTFTVAQFKKKADLAVADIIKRGKVPIIVGGTGFYIQAIVDNVVLPQVKPDNKIRTELEKKSKVKLLEILKKLDPIRAESIDKNNPRRIIRAIEIAQSLGSVPHLDVQRPSDYEVLEVGIKTDDKVLREKIEKRNTNMIKKGLVSEVEKVRATNISWKRIKELGFEYSFIAEFLRGNMTKEKALQRMNTSTWQYVKRQKTWFKRDKRIKWFELKDKKKIEKKVERFLN